MRQPAPDKAEREIVEALVRGMAILETLGAASGPLSLSDLARLAQLAPATARRSLLTFERLGYVRQEGRLFHLTPKILTLGSAFFFASGIDTLLQPALRAWVQRFGDAASVGSLSGSDVIYLAHESQQRAYRATATVGARYPAYATSMGRVMLAALAPDERQRRLAARPPEPLTRMTLTDPSRLAERIEDAARDGYAITVDQLDYGITALAVPIPIPGHGLIGSVNSSGYTGALTEARLLSERLEPLQDLARELGEQIARSPLLLRAFAQ